MEIKRVQLKQVTEEFAHLKPELIDESAVYFGYFKSGILAGIVSYVEHPLSVYLCHDYVKEEFRGCGIYKLLSEYREEQVKKLGKPISAHCNLNSIKQFLNNGYTIEKALFKVVKIC